MLSIDTSYTDDRETKAESPAKVSLTSITLRSPKHGMHPIPNEKRIRRPRQQSSASLTSQDYSVHSKSGHSKNSRTTKSSNDLAAADNANSDNGIVISAFSNLATQSIEEGKYQQALEFYQLALQDYTKETAQTTVVELVNAAATCFNLGALAKKLRDYSQAAKYFAQAQDIYEESGELVESFVKSGPPSPSGASSVASGKYSCQVCLLQLVVETLQARAHLHYKYQSLVEEAVECHEEVIELLNNESADYQSALEHDVVHHKIHFTMLPQRLRWQLLVTSLQALGKFYVEKGKLEEAIIAYQDTLSTLKKLNDFQVESTTQRQEEILQILGALSDFFMQNFIESTDVVKLERAAFLQEDLGRWEKAMQCWERVLYCQSKEHGENSFEVSIALGQLARVMVLEGNLEGALDLYKATADISLLNARSHSNNNERRTKGAVTFSIPEEIFCGILDVFHDLNRVPHAVEWLKELLSRSERREDQARIQLELGKLYLHQGFVQDASNALYLSLELFDGEDESAFELLQRVEFLGERGNQERNLDPRSNVDDEERADVDGLTAIMEDGESAYITDGTSAITSSLGAALDKMAEDDNDSEDLTKIMNEIDEENDNDLEESEETDSPSEASNTQHERSDDLIEAEEKEEELTEQINTDELYSKRVEVSEMDANDAGAPNGIADTEFDDTEQIQQDIAQFELPQSPLIHQNLRNDQMHDTPTTMNSPDSRTGLLQSTENSAKTKTALSLPKMSSTSPKSNSPKSSSPKRGNGERIPRGRKGYTEMSTLGKHPGGTGKRRIVNAIKRPFSRSRSKSRSSASNPLVPLDEEKEVRQLMPTKKQSKDNVEEESCNSHDAPISFIDVQAASSDDDRSLVSQLTFREYEMLSKRKEKQNESGHWWWGVTSEGLEGWFPSDYVNQAVEAAEGFLSAKSIHDRVKSRPLDFDSDEESEREGVEEDSLLKDSVSQPSKKAIESSKSNSSKPVESSESSPKESESSSRQGVDEPSAKKDVDESKVGTVKTSSLESLIQTKETELEDARKQHGHEHISVGTFMFDLAELHLKRRDATAAMLYARQAMKIQKSTLNLVEACKSLNFMAEIHSHENRYKDALLCYSEVQRIHESIYGYFHEEIATDLNHIGHILARQGKFDLAMDKHKEALRILKDVCGEDVKNPLVSETLIQIGAVYYKERNSLANIKSNQNDGYKTFIEGGMLEVIGRAHEDRGSYRMAIAFFEEKLQCLSSGDRPNESEDVAETLNSLGMLSCRAGMYLEAIDYYDRALGIQMKLGCDDVQLAMARVLAGSVQYSLGHFNKSLKLFQDALSTLRQLGLEQETVAATLFHIGSVHAAMCNYEEAMANLRNAFEIQSKLLGTEHPATFRTRREISNLYAIYESEADAAFDEYNDIMEAQKLIHGEKHPYVAETLHSIGCAQARKGDLTDALRTLEDCYNMRLKFLGMDHPQQATTLHEIAKIQLKRGRLKKAIHIIDAALNIRVESLSDQHIDVALAMTTKASCLVARLNFADANKLFAEALPIAKAAVGELHPSVAWIQIQIGVMHLRKCDFEKASDTVKEAIAIYRKANLDNDHPGIKEANEELEKIERAEMLCV